MSPRSCRSNLLDARSDSLPREEVSGVHETVASSRVAALLEETLGEANVVHVVRDVAEEKAASVAEDSLPALPVSSPSRVVGLVFGIVAVGLGIGFLLTRPAAPAASVPVASSPAVSIPPAAIDAAPSAAPVDSVTASTSEPPPTLADAEWMLRHGQPARAEAMYRAILASGGSAHEALTGLGKTAIYNRRPTEALAFFERALVRQPGYFPARLGRADALWDAGRRETAKAEYAAIRELYPDNTIAPRIVERARR